MLLSLLQETEGGGFFGGLGQTGTACPAGSAHVAEQPPFNGQVPLCCLERKVKHPSGSARDTSLLTSLSLTIKVATAPEDQTGDLVKGGVPQVQGLTLRRS